LAPLVQLANRAFQGEMDYQETPAETAKMDPLVLASQDNLAMQANLAMQVLKVPKVLKDLKVREVLKVLRVMD